jgi:hypothetical protein
MRFVYEDLSDAQFEKLVIFLCQKLLGSGVQGFCSGPDGGRDAKFAGTAELHPSAAAPWKGTIVIQAKHTDGYNRNFMESDFFSDNSTSTVIAEEIPRIKKLREGKNLDHYMLFANRRLSGQGELKIRTHLATQCDIPPDSIYLCGTEQLEIWLKRFPEVAGLADLDPVDSPLIVSPDELAEVVEAFAKQRETILAIVDDPPAPRVSYDDKNELNNMSAEYAKLQRRKYLKDTAQVRAFLSAPENLGLMNLYESVVDEFQLKITAKRKNHQTFDEVMEHLADQLFGRDPVLRQAKHKRLTRVLLFYMYWNCDIGRSDNAAAD